MKRNVRSNRASSIIEAVIGALFLIPVALLLLDLMVFLFGCSVEDTLVKNATRAAAKQPDFASAHSAFAGSLGSFQESAVLSKLAEQGFDYNPKVSVTGRIKFEVLLPMPFLQYHNIEVQAQDTEPILSN